MSTHNTNFDPILELAQQVLDRMRADLQAPSDTLTVSQTVAQRSHLEKLKVLLGSAKIDELPSDINEVDGESIAGPDFRLIVELINGKRTPHQIQYDLTK